MPTPESHTPSNDGSSAHAKTPRVQSAVPPGQNPPLQLAVYLGEATCLIGRLSLAGDLRLDGTLEGELLGAHRLVLGPSARVKGKLRAHSVIVLGAHVEADIDASSSIELRNGASVTGDLRAPHIHIDPDIEFHGRCDMTPSSERTPPTETGAPHLDRS